MTRVNVVFASAKLAGKPPTATSNAKNMDTSMKVLPLIFTPLLLAGCADSNEEFAEKVEKHVVEIGRSDDARRDAMKLCRALSEDRRSQEPQCVALQKEARGTPYKVPLPSDRSQDKAF